MKLEQVLEHDLYCIESNDNGNTKDIHILHTFTDDIERAPFVRTDFTFCIVPLNEFIEKMQERKADYKEYILELQEVVTQYEYDFDTFEDMVKDTLNFLGEGEPKPLDYDEITEDTPCGLYITKSRI